MVHFAYMPSPLPRQVGWNLFAHTIPSTSAFPRLVAGRLLHHSFRGLLGVYFCYGLHARQVAFATLCTRGFSSLVASTATLIATGWNEPVPGRVYPRCGPAPFHGAHGYAVNRDLAFFVRGLSESLALDAPSSELIPQASALLWSPS